MQFIPVNLALLMIFALVTCSITVFAQDDGSTIEERMAAREEMRRIEADYLRSGIDRKAIAVIKEHELASLAAFSFLVGLPGYEEAKNNETLLDFRQTARKNYKDYKKLDKAERKLREDKYAYMSSISAAYYEAYETFNPS